MTNDHAFSLADVDRDQAIAYLMGWLPADEQSAYRDKLEQAKAKMSYLGDLNQILGLLGSFVIEKEPPANLKAKLFDRLTTGETTPSKQEMPTTQAEISPLNWITSSEWKKTPIQGIHCRTLFADEMTKTKGMLLNISPGAQYPAHEHAGPENFFLIEGDLLIADFAGGAPTLMQAGDFQRSPAGSRHGRLSSPSGCIALVISSTQDKLLEDFSLAQK